MSTSVSDSACLRIYQLFCSSIKAINLLTLVFKLNIYVYTYMHTFFFFKFDLQNLVTTLGFKISLWSMRECVCETLGGAPHPAWVAGQGARASSLAWNETHRTHTGWTWERAFREGWRVGWRSMCAWVSFGEQNKTKHHILMQFSFRFLFRRKWH